MTTPFNRVKFIPVAGGTADFVVSAAVAGYSTPAERSVPTGTLISYTAESGDKSQWETGIGIYTVAGTTLSRDTIYENSAGTTVAINFSAAPAVWFDWHAQMLESYQAQEGRSISVRSGNGGVDPNSGGAITIASGQGGSPGAGGFLSIQSGNGGVVGGAGGDIQVIAGTAEGNGAGGSIDIESGTGFNDSGGNINIETGSGGNDGDGGTIIIRAGAAGTGVGAGGFVDVQTGNSGGTNANGGRFRIVSGTGSGTGHGGDIIFFWQAGGARTGLFFPNLPSGDPGVSGAAYVDGSGFVKISP